MFTVDCTILFSLPIHCSLHVIIVATLLLRVSHACIMFPAFGARRDDGWLDKVVESKHIALAKVVHERKCIELSSTTLP